MNVQERHQEGQSNQIASRNYADDNGNPAGGYCSGVGMCIHWQDGPRGVFGGEPNPANGAFVEDAILAAVQRLEFFERSQYAHPANAEAIRHCRAAIKALHDRAIERKSRGVLGVNAV